MHADGQLAIKRSLKFLRWLLPLGAIGIVLISGCNVDTRDEQGVGSGKSRPYSSIAVNADTDAVVGETATISTASTINFNHGKLSVSLDAMPLHQAITEVSRQTGIDIQFIDKLPASTVSLQFDGFPVEKGFRRLLNDVNTTFIYANTV